MSSSLAEAAKKTFRYVRVSVVAAVVLLFTALAVQIWNDSGHVQGTISAYYYTPVRSVLVAALVGAGFALIAIRGRPGVEDVLLDLAGLLLPLIAFIPTPIKGTVDAPCPASDPCIPAQFLPGVDVSVIAVLVLGVFGLVFAGFTVFSARQPDVSGRVGFGVAAVIWLLLLLGFGFSTDWPPRQWLDPVGHCAAAVPMFGLIVIVALLSARHSQRDVRVAKVSISYRAVYRFVGLAIALVLAVALLYWFFAVRPSPGVDSPFLFWLQVALLTLFAVFWVAQTAEFWNQTMPG